MMDIIKNNMVAIVGSILLELGGFVYYAYFSSGAGSELTSTDESAVSQDLLSTLSSLHTLQLDDSIFTDPSFISLSDFGVVIPSQTVGRQNPFLPISGSVQTKK